MGGPDQHRPGACGGGAAGRTLGDEPVGTEMDRLVTALQRAVEARREILELHARPVGVRITADYAHQASAIGTCGLQTDAGDDIIAGTDREAVEISSDGQNRLTHTVSVVGAWSREPTALKNVSRTVSRLLRQP